MRLLVSIPIFSLIALVVSSPVPDSDSDESKSTGDDGIGKNPSVLSSTTYDEISLCDKKAGTAEQDFDKLFSKLDVNNLAGVSAEDLQIIKNVHSISNRAEVDGFNPAIDAASGAEAKALQNGKICNKVLKVGSEVLVLQIKAAQGDPDNTKLEEEKKKLMKNVELDKKAAGQRSQRVSFEGTT